MPASRAVSSALTRQPRRSAPERRRRLRRNGATRRTPIASPAHQTAQVEGKLLIGIAPESVNTEVPMVALMVIPTNAPRTTMAMASRIRSSCRRKPARRRSSLETSGASVLPHAMAAAPSGDGPSGRLTANAAIAMAGHIRRPRVRNVTRAIPVGGQIGVTWPWIRARFRLRCAAPQ